MRSGFTLWSSQAQCFSLDYMMGLGASRVDGDGGEGLNHMTSFGGVTWLEGTRRDNDILTVPPKEIMKCSHVFL